MKCRTLSCPGRTWSHKNPLTSKFYSLLDIHVYGSLEYTSTFLLALQSDQKSPIWSGSLDPLPDVQQTPLYHRDRWKSKWWEERRRTLYIPKRTSVFDLILCNWETLYDCNVWKGYIGTTHTCTLFCTLTILHWNLNLNLLSYHYNFVCIIPSYITGVFCSACVYLAVEQVPLCMWILTCSVFVVWYFMYMYIWCCYPLMYRTVACTCKYGGFACYVRGWL